MHSNNSTVILNGYPKYLFVIREKHLQKLVHNTRRTLLQQILFSSKFDKKHVKIHYKASKFNNMKCPRQYFCQCVCVQAKQRGLPPLENCVQVKIKYFGLKNFNSLFKLIDPSARLGETGKYRLRHKTTKRTLPQVTRHFSPYPNQSQSETAGHIFLSY